LRLQRGTAAGAVCALFNFNPEEELATVLPEVPVDWRWEKLLDSGEPDWGGNGAMLPEQAGGLAALCLPVLGFAAYQCRPAGESKSAEEGN
jgi:hypothetical protein